MLGGHMGDWLSVYGCACGVKQNLVVRSAWWCGLQSPLVCAVICVVFKIFKECYSFLELATVAQQRCCTAECEVAGSIPGYRGCVLVGENSSAFVYHAFIPC